MPVLSEKGSALLEDLPVGRDDPLLQAMIDAPARELQRVEDAVDAFLAAVAPQNTTDEQKMLSLWEFLLGLPVAPVGVPDSERISKVVAHFRKRSSAKATTWLELLTEAIGSENWSHLEVAPYNVTILIPQASDSYTAEIVRRLSRKITPAHLTLSFTYGQGFVAGVSLAGIDVV